ncbi:MAG: acyl-CoA dehydrogenase [Methyloligellaceae bacterium]
MTFTSPIDEMLFTLKHIAGVDEIISSNLFPDFDQDLLEAVLNEAGRFANEQLAPLNIKGDEHGAKLVDGKVILPDGWAETYKNWAEGGWASLPGSTEYGGQGLPMSLSLACSELWNSAAMAFGLCPLLTQGAVNALTHYGNDELKQRYLPQMISGEWTGTMLLTEPQAGSDLGHIRTKAVRQDDGSFKLSGTKIFITYGEHSLTDNIIHMVLGRIEGAPEGTRGISLFLVPKFMLNEDGSIGARNDVHCTKLEEKLGIHASPTCVMNMGDEGGAVGYLVGEENRGLNAMFKMMNEARIGVGAQGVAIAERAFQHALNYAKDRKQGRAKDTPAGEMAPIIQHPDIQRMLLESKAKIAASRAICYTVAKNIDIAENSKDPEQAAIADAKVALLTPVAKAYSTDIGVEVASEAVQVHGGMGYIEETGAAQHMRDARIAPIYEGTNGIQAMDLVGRKLPMEDGKAIRAHIAELRSIADDLRASNRTELGKAPERIDTAITALENATKWIFENLASNSQAVMAGAVPYQKLFALATGGAYLAKGCLSAMKSGDAPDHSIISTRYFAENVCVEAPALETTVTEGADSILLGASSLL